MKSVYDAIKFLQSLVPDIRTADANGTVIDTMGYNSGVLMVNTGAIDETSTDETYTVKVQEGDESDGSDMADVSGATTTVTAAGVALIRVEGLGTSRKRYLRAVLDVGGTTPSHEGAATFVLGNAYKEPVNS